MKTIYIVTVNGKISQEAYSTIEAAQKFVIGRTGIADIISRNYVIVEDTNDNRYEIHDVKVQL